MTTTKDNTKYYRPYLTLAELEELREATLAGGFSASLSKKIHKLHLSATAGITAASYKANPRESLLDKLGGGSTEANTSIDPATARLAAYHKRLAGEQLTKEEESLADTYEWEQEE